MEVKTYYCQMVTDRIETMVPNLERAFPYFDQFIIVDGGSTDGTIEWLEQQPKVDLVHFKWCDDFPKSRNQYLKRLAEIRSPDEISICCVADDDEFYSDFLMKNMKLILRQTLGGGYNQLAIRCRSVTVNKDGNRVTESLDEFWKPLIFVWEPGLHYADTTLHETLVPPSGMRQTRANDFADTDQELLYEHTKREGIIWPRGLRNFYICGGGTNLQDKQPLWHPFRELISKYVEFESWIDIEEYFRKGNIAQEIKDWFIEHRKDGLPSYDAKFTEIREGFLTYFIWYHPEELPSELIEQDKAYMNYPAEIKRIHG